VDGISCQRSDIIKQIMFFRLDYLVDKVRSRRKLADVNWELRASIGPNISAFKRRDAPFFIGAGHASSTNIASPESLVQIVDQFFRLRGSAHSGLGACGSDFSERIPELRLDSCLTRLATNDTIGTDILPLTQ
jgi:hypothetical protein